MSKIKQLERFFIRYLPAPIKRRFIESQANSKAILRSMFWLILFVLGAKIIAAVKELAIAWHYGTSDILDGYLLIFNLAGWPISLFGSVIGFVLVPGLVQLKNKEASFFRNWQKQITAWVWILALAITAITAAIYTFSLNKGWLGLSAAGAQAAQEVLPWLSLMTGLGMIASWHACQLMSVQRHANTFLEAMPSLAILIAVLLWSSDAVQPLLWGTVIGFVIQTVLVMWAVRSAGMPVSLTTPTTQVFSSTMRTAALWLLAGQIMLSVTSVVDQVILAHLSPGSLAAFGYAFRVLALFLSLTALVLNRSLLPVLAGISDADESYQLTRIWGKRVGWASLIIVIGIFLFGNLGIKLLFERGAFTAQDTAEVAWLLMVMALQIPFFLTLSVWTQWVLTRPGHGQAMWWAATAGTIAKLAVMFGCIEFLDWGASAVALSLAAFSMVYLLILQTFIRRDRRHNNLQ